MLNPTESPEAKESSYKKELKDSQTAILNVLEDLQVEKENLSEAKAKDEAMLANIGEGLVATDRDGRIILANAASEKLLGWKESEVKGKLLSKVIPMLDENGKNIPRSERLITRILKEHSSTSTSTSTYYKRKDGISFPVAITVAPVFVGNEFTGAVEVFRDITKEKAVDKAKTEFVSLASHQLRTPLSTVNWYAEMLLAGDVGKVTPEQKKYLDEVYRSNQRMVKLVNDLLSVSRLELGILVVEPEPTDVVELLRSAIDEQKIQIDEKKIKFSPSFEKNISLMQVDPKLLHMIVQNLLSNAVKYTPDKGIVSIDLRLVKRGASVDNQKANEDSIAIIVSDTGLGIPKGQQDRIFTKLFRADNVRKKDTEGTGLGLYIVKSIVEHSGGKIWFESKENKGTTFWVMLPLEGMKQDKGTTALS